MWLDRSYEYWAAVFAAILVKLKTSESLGVIGVLSTIVVALISSYVFGGYLVTLKPDIPLTVAGAIAALIGEELMRYAIKVSKDPKFLLELLRGKK